jgi:hypothetical protein
MSDLFTPAQLCTELLERSRQLDAAHDELRRCSFDYASAENQYRKAKALAYLAAEGPVAERQAVVDTKVENERYHAHLAEGLRVAALESVRSRRAQLTAVQTIVNATRSELELARTGPDEVL